MTSDPVDDLLGALDRALDVEPAPQALARIRAAIEGDRGRAVRAPRWLAVAASVAVAAIGAWWFSGGPGPERARQEPQVARSAGAPQPRDAASPTDASATAPAPGARTMGDAPAATLPAAAVKLLPGINPSATPGALETTAAPVATADREPGVVVSPEVKAGLDQLVRALASGRLLPVSVDPEPETFEPLVIVPTIVNPAVVGAGPEESGRGSVSPNGQFNGPPGRTGSLL